MSFRVSVKINDSKMYLAYDKLYKVFYFDLDILQAEIFYNKEEVFKAFKSIINGVTPNEYIKNYYFIRNLIVQGKSISSLCKPGD